MSTLALLGVAVKKLVLAILMLGCVAMPAFAQPQPRECTRLTQQITRYQRDAGWARERENPLWEQASLNQIERLALRRAKRCPRYVDQNDTLAQFATLALKVGRLAARYFLMGL